MIAILCSAGGNFKRFTRSSGGFDKYTFLRLTNVINLLSTVQYTSKFLSEMCYLQLFGAIDSLFTYLDQYATFNATDVQPNVATLLTITDNLILSFVRYRAARIGSTLVSEIPRNATTP